MDLYSVVQDKILTDSTSYLTSDRKQLVEHASEFLTRLSIVCADKSVKGYWDTVIDVQADGTSADISSPFGTATIRLDLLIFEAKVEGSLTIHKGIADDLGRPASKKVAAIRVTKQGIYLGKSQQYPMLGATRLSREDKEAYQTVAALLYAIGTCE